MKHTMQLDIAVVFNAESHIRVADTRSVAVRLSWCPSKFAFVRFTYCGKARLQIRQRHERTLMA